MTDNFRTAHGEVYDLDDPGTYIGQPVFEAHKTTLSLSEWAWCEIGKSLVYMDFLYEDADWSDQRRRVFAFAREFAREFDRRRWPDSAESRQWWRKFMFRFLDEVENQC